MDTRGLLTARRQEVRVWLPRFRLEVALQLNQPMKDLGMLDAFDSAAADFSGMTGSPGLFGNRDELIREWRDKLGMTTEARWGSAATPISSSPPSVGPTW